SLYAHSPPHVVPSSPPRRSSDLILRARAAEQEIARALESAGVWDDPAAAVPREAVERFQSAVAAAARPIDDVRGSAAYRRHACGDRKSTRLNSSHLVISYDVFCL